GSVLVILLGFAKSNRVLIALGTIFLAVFMISFYYFLQQTLLIKSLNLMVTGGLFLIIGYVFSQLKKRAII
ncbi:MAG: DUF4401 domain-containing protein, partial [Fibrobacter sp.]|nr:DUF4401 domain-containing protein [Fibrobacter sp.]